ncbi:TPA: hypothetical protein R4338_000661 [Pasteurella multocida]|uniref:hypothetical protein n=1 Tax=Pasteurella multocida TaxID=747 RepID=UPI0028DEC789|nr:hypothetical protein [Pasteurella multocida]MDY0498121.1 hypothetical protein [Pasteurella multocida]MDY0655875.1 hypothetical protein [Pasteurella multocida]WRU40338.1 hypothetical protein VA609_09520 [Pasteurella multocida]HDR0998565.1 hypothetical protein [Pasteurella multocida]HDR1014352.1 hypothetical protein [Pasteurella multocida]
MKKITQLSLVTCFALSLIACDNASNTPKTTEPAPKAEITLSPQEQFRKDYEAFETWQSTTDQRMNKEVDGLQQKVAQIESGKQLSPEEINTLISNLRTQIQTSSAELDGLQLKDADVLLLAEKTKAAHSAAIDMLELVVKATANPLEEAQKDLASLEAKLNEMDKLHAEMETQKEKLKQQYQQK